MKKIKLLKKKEKYLAQIFQALEIKFAFVSKKQSGSYKQQHVPVKCRDFLGDCIWSKETKQKVNIYGFQYNYNKNPFDNNAVKLSVTFPNKAILDNFKNNFNYLIEKENIANVINSTYHLTTDPLSIIIIGDREWQSSLWKLSLYTFYIKCASYKTINHLEAPENVYYKLLSPEKEQVLLSKIKIKMKVSVCHNITVAHNSSGFVAIIRKYNKELYNELFKGNV